MNKEPYQTNLPWIWNMPWIPNLLKHNCDWSRQLSYTLLKKRICKPIPTMAFIFWQMQHHTLHLIFYKICLKDFLYLLRHMILHSTQKQYYEHVTSSSILVFGSNTCAKYSSHLATMNYGSICICPFTTSLSHCIYHVIHVRHENIHVTNYYYPLIKIIIYYIC